MSSVNIPIQFFRSSTAGALPPSAQLLIGGIAINFADEKIYTKDNNNTIKQLGLARGDLATVALTGNYNDLINKPTAGDYTLPPASASVLGGVMVPANGGLSIDSSGNLTNAGVVSVNSRSGKVTLTATDVGLPTDLLSGPSGTVATKYLPSSLTGGLSYQGNWDASANSPTLSNGGVANGTALANGSYYVVSVAGTTTLDGIGTWTVGDLAIVSNNVWTRIANSGTNVTSVNGKTGAVTLTASDISGLATVAKSGNYNDLSNKPTPYSLPIATTSSLGGVLLNTTPGAAGNAASGKLATVALTGSYTDLTNLPTSPDTARLPVNVQGNPNVINEVFYDFATACQFPANFAGSVATIKTVTAGAPVSISIMQYVKGGNGNGNVVGSITMDTSGNITFASTGGAVTTYGIGDELSYRFNDTNVSRMTVTLLGTWQ